eukprot:2872995-Rhodomonas_salina.1
MNHCECETTTTATSEVGVAMCSLVKRKQTYAEYPVPGYPGYQGTGRRGRSLYTSNQKKILKEYHLELPGYS